jgi:hypothetical protein
VTGDLLRVPPLDYWSELTLVVSPALRWDHPPLRTLYQIEEPRIVVIDVESATPAQEQAIELRLSPNRAVE